MSKICKISSLCLLIIAFTLGCVDGFKYKDFISLIYFGVGGFFSFLIIYTLGEILSKLNKLLPIPNTEKDDTVKENSYSNTDIILAVVGLVIFVIMILLLFIFEI